MRIYEYYELNSMSLHQVPREVLLTLNCTQLVLYEYKLSPVTPDPPINFVSDTLINATLWDKEDSSTQVFEHLYEGFAPPLAPNQNWTLPGITGRYSVWCWSILHEFNSNEYLLLSVTFSRVLRDTSKLAGICHKKFILIPCIWFFSSPHFSLVRFSVVLGLTQKRLIQSKHQ
jgi:hypothetical protein